MAAGPGPLVTAESVTKVYRRGREQVRALDGADLAVAPGELVAVVGPSGSGKTTLLNVLAGFEVPDSGRVGWAGASIAQAASDWSQIAVVPQRLGLLDECTIAENVGLPLRLAGLDDALGRVAGLLAVLGLADRSARLPHETSLGEQQRAAVARALVRHPRLVIADEPSGHQDKLWGARVFRALRDTAERHGTACVVATHSREFLAAVDRVVAMHDGRIASVEAADGPGRWSVPPRRAPGGTRRPS